MLKERINIIVLHHDSSKKTLDYTGLEHERTKVFHINCGRTNSYPDGYSESKSFIPNYSHVNPIFFESSVMLTVYEHRKELFEGGHMMFVHTDVVQNHPIEKLIELVDAQEGRFAVSISPKKSYNTSNLVIDGSDLKFSLDPWHVNEFDGSIDVWDVFRKSDPESFFFLKEKDPEMVYSHQYVCDWETWNDVMSSMKFIVGDMKIKDCGLWSCHVCERLIAAKLAMFSENVTVTSMFSHLCSSGSGGPGDLSLYGPRSYEYFKIKG